MDSVKSVGSRPRITSPCSSCKSPGTSNTSATWSGFQALSPQQKSEKRKILPSYPFVEAGEVNAALLHWHKFMCSQALKRNWLQNPALYQMGTTDRKTRNNNNKKRAFKHITFSSKAYSFVLKQVYWSTSTRLPATGRLQLKSSIKPDTWLKTSFV